MREQKFKDWMEAYRSKAGNELEESTKHTYMTDNKRVESEDGFDLDKEFDKDKLASLIDRYEYSAEDEKNGRKNPTNLNIKHRSKSVRNSLASHRTALRHYRRFRSGIMTP